MTSPDDPARWLTLERKKALETPIFSVHSHLRAHPRRETQATFWSLSPDDWVNILAITPDQQLVLVKQYRHGTDSLTLEIPGGAVDAGEDPMEAARRELREETGFSSNTWKVLGRIAVNPAFMTNYCTTLLALDATATHRQDFDEHEELRVHLIELDAFFDAIDTGTIDHGIVVSAAYFLRRHLDALSTT